MLGKLSGFLITLTMAFAAAFPASAADREWQTALARNNGHVAQKLLIWLNVTETDQPVGIQELIRFTRENSGWPKLHMFRDRVEKDIGDSLPPSEISAWFEKNPPKTAKGIRSFIAALARLDHDNRAKQALRKFWLTAELDRKETASLAKEFKKLFSPTDHIDRLDNLLWEQRYQESEYMLPLVDADHGKLADARIALGRMSSKVNKLVQRVPASMVNDNGLMFDRLKWRRQMNKDADAIELLRYAAKDKAHESLWWRERNILARRAIEKKNYAGAYKTIAGHGMTSGIEYTQAEWMLGWLALSFLHQPDKAYRHFENFYSAVNSAVSRSRGAYWLARASEAMNKTSAAKSWDKMSAQFPSTFYGQLSTEKISKTMDVSEFTDDTTIPDSDDFDESEIVRAIRLLHSIGEVSLATPFFIKLLDKAKDKNDFILIAKLARDTGRPYFAVESNKQMQQKLGDFLFTEGYPLLPSLPASQPESALIHAIVHRESMFDTLATSSAGARGLMQLMPGTAKQVSRNMGKRFTIGKLTENPQYNVELGASYLQYLLKSYDGFYPLAIAAYNAGPRNVDQWIKTFGDPRRGKVNIVDWIEQVPIYETRNYIQRVMESYYIYKLKMSEEPKTVLDFGRG